MAESPKKKSPCDGCCYGPCVSFCMKKCMNEVFNKGFEKVARKYGIDYAIRKDSSVDPPHYLVFFKAKDADAMTAAFNEYSQRVLRREERPSVLEQLRKIKAAILALPGRVINRDRQREQTR